MFGNFISDFLEDDEGKGKEEQPQPQKRQQENGQRNGQQGQPTNQTHEPPPEQSKPAHDNDVGRDDFDPRNPEYDVTFNPASSDGQMGKEVYIEDQNGRPFGGEWVRDMFENAYDKPTQATWIGYKSNPQDGLREIPIEHKAWFRHASVFGTTGYGKTTFLKNLMVQWAYSGYGFCFIDPKGDGVRDLMEELPDHRLDDVIWIDPAPEDRNRVVGINFLEIGGDDEAEKQYEMESVIDDLENIVKDESYWGPRMASVFASIARGMIESEKSYTLIDMYQVLVDENYREMFVEDVDDPLVRDYVRQIAEEMDQSDLDALIRRLKRLVENNITREIIAHQSSDINLKDAVENGKIILVANDQDDADAKQMIATGLMRRIWAAIKSRKAVPEDERTPYYLIVDEFDDVVTENADVDKMLSKARSFRLSVTLCNQQPSQLPKDIQQAIMGNCDNLLAFNPNNPADARLIMKKFGDYGASDLTNLGRFKMFTRIKVNNETSPPFITYTFADYPPLRTREEARKAVDRSLERYGTERLDPREIARNAVLDMDSQEPGKDDQTGGGASQELQQQYGGDDDELHINEQDVLEAIYAVELKHDAKGEYIPVDNVQEELGRRLDEEMYKSVPAEAIEQLNESPTADLERQENELRIRLTNEGHKEVVNLSSGSVATGGGSEHRYILKRAFETFTMAGFKVTIPEQEGKEQPDGIAEIPMDMTARNRKEMMTKMQKLEENHPIVAHISDGTDINIEAEATTINKPKQTLKNLRKAIENERTCVFCVKDMESEKGDIRYYARKGAKILMHPPLIRAKDRHGNRQFYNKSNRLELEDGVYAIRPRDSGHHTEWWEMNNGSVQLRDRKSSDIITEFRDYKQALNPTKDDVPAYYRYDQSKNAFVLYENKAGERERHVYTEKDRLKDDWIPIRPPFIPEAEFPRKPREDDWKIVIFPDDDKDIPPQEYIPRITADNEVTGELQPLVPPEHLPDKDLETTQTDTEQEMELTAKTETKADTSSPDPSGVEVTEESLDDPVEMNAEESSTDSEQSTEPDHVTEETPIDDGDDVALREFELVHDGINDMYHVIQDKPDKGGASAYCGDFIPTEDIETTEELDDYELCIACETKLENG